MTIFYINNDKEKDVEFKDKYDFAKFINDKSDEVDDRKLKIKKVIK